MNTTGFHGWGLRAVVLLSPQQTRYLFAPPMIVIRVTNELNQIIMIHRPFLFQSFQKTQYSYTRNTCVLAAVTILREHQRIADEDDISIWTHSAFCVTAAMVLGLELLYPRKDDASKIVHYRDLVIAAKERLDNRQSDVMASRGVRLINTILQEATGEGEVPGDNQEYRKSVVDFRKVLARFLSLDDTLPVFNSDTPDLSQLAGSDPDLRFPMLDDFDVWLNQLFGYD